jgi:hypothetical protein
MSRFSQAYHKVGGRSIFAHKIAKISKGSGTDFLATQLYSARMLASLYDHHLFVIFASFCADPSRAMVAPPRRPRSRRAACELPVRSEIGPYQKPCRDFTEKPPTRPKRRLLEKRGCASQLLSRPPTLEDEDGDEARLNTDNYFFKFCAKRPSTFTVMPSARLSEGLTIT